MFAVPLNQKARSIMKTAITGLRSELGSVMARQSVRAAAEGVRINLTGQQANTPLHDGHGWKDFSRTTLATTKRALRAAQASGASLFVQASFAFVNATEHGAKAAAPLRSAVDTSLECEALVPVVAFTRVGLDIKRYRRVSPRPNKHL